MGLFDKYTTQPKAPKTNSVSLKKTLTTIRTELTKLDWNSREAVYEFFENNLMDSIYYLGTNEDLYKNFGIRGEIYITIDAVLTQNPNIVLPKNIVIHLNDCMFGFLFFVDPVYFGPIYTKTKESIINISKLINKSTYERLDFVDCCSNEQLLDYLPICRNSSLEESINIQRTNVIIMTSLNPRLTSEEDIKDLYGELFYENWEELFLNSMTEVYPSNIKEDDGWMYDMMTNALLEMLNEKPMSEIKSILIKYSEKCLKMQLTKVGVRCSLFELSSDYDKIVYIAEELRDQGMYII